MSEPVRILVVDEDRAARDLTRAYLEREDDRFVVETVGRSSDALDRVEAGAVDAVVSDWHMPGMDGVELANAILTRGDAIPFVLFSGGEEPIDAPGIDAVVRKGAGTAHYGAISDAIRDALDG